MSQAKHKDKNDDLERTKEINEDERERGQGGPSARAHPWRLRTTAWVGAWADARTRYGQHDVARSMSTKSSSRWCVSATTWCAKSSAHKQHASPTCWRGSSSREKAHTQENKRQANNHNNEIS